MVIIFTRDKVKSQPTSVCLLLCLSGSKITDNNRFFFLSFVNWDFTGHFVMNRVYNLPKIIGIVSIKIQENVILNFYFRF